MAVERKFRGQARAPRPGTVHLAVQGSVRDALVSLE